MERITLDCTKCQYISHIYKEIKTKFDLPDYMGENLSALWDFLDGYCSYELIVLIKGHKKLPSELSEYINELFIVFERVSKHNPNIVFEYEE